MKHACLILSLGKKANNIKHYYWISIKLNITNSKCSVLKKHAKNSTLHLSLDDGSFLFKRTHYMVIRGACHVPRATFGQREVEHNVAKLVCLFWIACSAIVGINIKI